MGDVGVWVWVPGVHVRVCWAVADQGASHSHPPPLKNTLRWLMGEEQITHLGVEYYQYE